MKKRNPIYTAGSFLLAGALTLSMAACSGAQAPAEATQTPSATATPAATAAPAEETTPSAPVSGALPVKALQPKQVEENPYMAKSDANIHHDGYNTDSTDEILPLGIYPEIHVSYETTNANASPAIYFDSYGHAVVPLLGGIAIRDLNAEETKTLGYFSPKQHDGGSYLIQSSYTFLDAENRIVCPTSNNHVLMLRATDEAGNVLPEFEKVLDIDIKAAAEAALGKELTQNLLSVVFDYDGNLWFATGGFRIYPERQQQGVLGYIAHSAIEAILNGEQTDLSKAVFVYELTPGEGAENGIAASKDGAVILTNKNCYLLRANNGVEAVWCTPYESVGAKVSGEGDKTTGGGLAWGGGCSPTLTPNLVMSPTMKTLDPKKAENKAEKAAVNGSAEDATVSAPSVQIDLSKVKIEPLFADDVDFETFSKSDFRVVKIEACEAVPKSKKLLKFTLNDGTDRKRTILSGIHEYYEPEELVGKTCVAITNLPPRKMMGIDSEGMLISAVYEYDGREGLNLLMLDDSIPAGAKLY